MKNNYLIKVSNLSKSYKFNRNNINIFNNLTLSLENNFITSIVGPSGSGKSTFLNIIGLLDRDYSGEYFFKNLNTKKFNKKEINITRGASIGFVHQFFHLIPELTVLENVALPYLINTNESEGFEKSKNLLEIFGLKDRTNFKPTKLSGGEQQRVAIARSLINNPDLILADEMTGNLDEETSDKIFNFFMKTIKKNNQSLIYVTHNIKYAKEANIRYKIFKKNICKL